MVWYFCNVWQCIIIKLGCGWLVLLEHTFVSFLEKTTSHQKAGNFVQIALELNHDHYLCSISFRLSGKLQHDFWNVSLTTLGNIWHKTLLFGFNLNSSWMLLEFEFTWGIFKQYICSSFAIKEFLGAIKGTEGKFIKEDIS